MLLSVRKTAAPFRERPFFFFACRTEMLLSDWLQNQRLVGMTALQAAYNGDLHANSITNCSPLSSNYPSRLRLIVNPA